MSHIAEWIGVSRQAIYKSRKQFDTRGDLREKITEFVKAQRLVNKKIGGVKLTQCFAREHPEESIGRDRFLDILREEGLLLRRRRVAKRASASEAERDGRQDLAHKLSVAGPGHLWVQDDTEVVLLEGKAHLALSTDAYSHKVVGYSWSRRANSAHVQAALKMALEGHVHGDMTLIHHSDNGSIYGSKAYQLLLKNQPIAISWSPPGRPDRNPIAERINLTFKDEYLCDSHTKGFEQIEKELPMYINHYNDSRPHMSCGNGYPSQIHEGIGEPKKLWKQRPASYPRPTPEGVPPQE